MRALPLLLAGLAACGDARAQAPATPATPTAPAEATADLASTAAVRLGRDDAPGTIVAAHIVSRVADQGVADDQPKRALRDDGVVLYAVLEVTDGGTRRWFSDAGEVRLAGRTRTTRPIAEAPAFAIAWRKLEPTAANLSNEASGSFRYEAIEYAATDLAASVARVDADVRPTLTPDHGHGVGTMRYQLEVAQDDRVVTSPGTEARRKRGAGGLTDAVHRVSLRRDDTYLGYLTEMYGQPYIWASAGGTDATHQSERLEGSDCADFMVYGARRLGHDVPYVWTGALPEHTRTLARGSADGDGVYRDRQGAPVPFTGVGDLVLFPRHVGALVEDRGTPGVLDHADLIMHTYFDSPREVPLADSGYADRPIQLLRWK